MNAIQLAEILDTEHQTQFAKDVAAELRRLHKDAARYQFLRNDQRTDGLDVCDEDFIAYHLDDLDQAIDAAMEPK